MTTLQHNIALVFVFMLAIFTLNKVETWSTGVKTQRIRDDYSQLQNQYNELKHKVDMLERKQNCQDNGGVLVIDYLGNAACALLRSRWGV